MEFTAADANSELTPPNFDPLVDQHTKERPNTEKLIVTTHDSGSSNELPPRNRILQHTSSAVPASNQVIIYG